MSIPTEELSRLIFDEGKNFKEIAIIYGISPNKVKQIIKNSRLNLNRVKSCKSCGFSGPSTPPEGSNGMSFDLTKD